MVNLIWLGLLLCGPSLVSATGAPRETAPEDARTLLERVIDAQKRLHEAQRSYAFRERTVTRHLDKRGEIAKTESETFLVTPSTGGEYRRLVSKDGRALSAKEDAKEERKLREHIDEQLRMSEEEREQQDRDKLEERVERYQSRLEEALEAFDFEPLPDDVVDGASLRVFRFAPKPGYKGHSRPTKILARMEGTVWIDAERDQLAKLSVEFIEDLNFLGGVFGRVSEGTRATVEGTLRGDLWLLDNVDVFLNARLYFLKRYRRHISVDYDDYRRYRVDTEESLTAPTSSASER